jgi:hypothetical protein
MIFFSSRRLSFYKKGAKAHKSTFGRIAAVEKGRTFKQYEKIGMIHDGKKYKDYK